MFNDCKHRKCKLCEFVIAELSDCSKERLAELRKTDANLEDFGNMSNSLNTPSKLTPCKIMEHKEDIKKYKWFSGSDNFVHQNNDYFVSSVDRNSHALNFHCESEESYGEMNSNVSCHCQMSMVNKAPSLEIQLNSEPSHLIPSRNNELNYYDGIFPRSSSRMMEKMCSECKLSYRRRVRKKDDLKSKKFVQLATKKTLPPGKKSNELNDRCSPCHFLLNQANRQRRTGECSSSSTVGNQLDETVKSMEHCFVNPKAMKQSMHQRWEKIALKNRTTFLKTRSKRMLVDRLSKYKLMPPYKAHSQIETDIMETETTHSLADSSSIYPVISSTAESSDRNATPAVMVEEEVGQQQVNIKYGDNTDNASSILSHNATAANEPTTGLIPYDFSKMKIEQINADEDCDKKCSFPLLHSTENCNSPTSTSTIHGRDEEIPDRQAMLKQMWSLVSRESNLVLKLKQLNENLTMKQAEISSLISLRSEIEDEIEQIRSSKNELLAIAGDMESI
ncbi:unnamed protein product [Dracunculus medinensis]|uniref:SCHIP-1 domain-containing protein n=1 Tax=Dracunculus medinensis TaxID=318479 RepID=A0A0N4U700_DRAME|nr:unnamed protein product [Dracunculus medinensis]